MHICQDEVYMLFAILEWAWRNRHALFGFAKPEMIHVKRQRLRELHERLRVYARGHQHGVGGAT